MAITTRTPGASQAVRPLLLALLAMPACSGLGRPPSGMPEPALASERYQLSGETVAVYDAAGEVRVEPVASGDVVVTVTRIGAEANRLRVLVERSAGGDVLRLDTDARRLFYPGLAGGSDSLEFRNDTRGFKRGRGGVLGLFAGRSLKVVRRSGAGGTVAHADVVVALPPGRRLDVQVGAGRLFLGAVAGDVRGGTLGGAIEAEAPGGRVALTAGSGGISARGGGGELILSAPRGAVDVTGFDGRALSVRTGAGSVTIADARAQSVEVSVGAGDVSLERVRGQRLHARSGAGELRVRQVVADSLVARSGVGAVVLAGVTAGHVAVDAGKGNVEVGLVAVPGSLHVRADGGATLTLPGASDAELRLRTDHGRLLLELPASVLERSRKRLVARLGRGGPVLEVEGEHDVTARAIPPSTR